MNVKLFSLRDSLNVIVQESKKIFYDLVQLDTLIKAAEFYGFRVELTSRTSTERNTKAI